MTSSLFTFANLHRAWLACRRGKRGRESALRFEASLERNLVDLVDELRARRWEPSPSACFVTERPKHREIFAAEFRDRVVHHLVVSHLEPYWERRFVHDTYACRRGQGTHAAVARLQTFLRRATANGSRRAWFLHLDIRSFFVSIDKAILHDLLQRALARDGAPWREEMAWLLGRVVLQDPARNAVRKGRGFERVPAHKSLYSTGGRTGLPIGNYTSQFFANVYLDGLDQFVKRMLRCPFYLRYVDDLVLVSPEPERLGSWEEEIAAWLGRERRLELNPRSRRLAPATSGCDFLGYIVRPNYLLVRRRTVARCREALTRLEARLVRRRRGSAALLRFPEREVERLRAMALSYSGALRFAATRRLRVALARRFAFCNWYFARRKGRVVARDRPAGTFGTLSEQYRAFAREWRGALLLFRIGFFYEFFENQRPLARRWLYLAPGRSRAGLGGGLGLPATSPRLAQLVARPPVPVVVVRQTARTQGAVRERRVERVLLPASAAPVLLPPRR